MEICKGTALDIDAFISLLHIVRSGMDHAEWFYLDPPEEIREMIANGSLEFWTAKDNGAMAAAFSVIHPGLSDLNYGYDLGLSEKDLLRVVNMDTIAVLPVYRGRGLQYALMQRAESDVCSDGDKILLCTVHPDNCYSLKNILAQGYTIQRNLAKYNSVRYILRKDRLKN